VKFKAPILLTLTLILSLVLSTGSVANTKNKPKKDEIYSIKANLPAFAYKDLACDPFDPRLKKKKLPNGVGPEARVAAACIQMAWIEGGKRSRTPSQITFSPSFPKKYRNIIKKGIQGGDRIYGHLMYPGTRYEAVFASDESWMCEYGKKNVDTRAIGKGTQFQSWASNRNSGCPGAPSTFAGWEPKILGANGEIIFMWSFVKKKDFNEFGTGPSKWLKFVSHEYVHGLQSQRAYAQGFTDKSPVSPSPWYGEGQAQYIGFSTGGLIASPADLRPFALQELKRDLKRYKLKSVDLNNIGFNRNSELAFSAGYFAYEYLLAHYGLERTFNFYTDWAAAPCDGNFQECWRGSAQSVFGKSADQLINDLNRYINAQI